MLTYVAILWITFGTAFYPEVTCKPRPRKPPACTITRWLPHAFIKYPIHVAAPTEYQCQDAVQHALANPTRAANLLMFDEVLGERWPALEAEVKQPCEPYWR